MRNPRSIIRRTGSGPAATNSSLPTFSAQAAGSRRSTNAFAWIGSAKSSATMTLGSACIAPFTRAEGIDSGDIAIRCLGAPRRIRFPFAAAGAAPVILLGTEAALFATVHAKALDMLRHQTLDQLEVVAPFSRRGNQLRLEQLVQPKQRRIAHKLVLDELRRCVSTFMRKHLAEERVQEIERRILVLVAAQHPYSLRNIAAFSVRLGEPVRDQAEEGRVLRFDALPDCGRSVVITLPELNIAEQNGRSRAQLVFRQSLFEMAARFLELRAQHSGLRQLAIIVGDFLEVRSLCQRLHALGHSDRLLPVLFLLEDLQQEAERLDLERAAVELAEELFGAIEEPGAVKILRQLEHCQLP